MHPGLIADLAILLLVASVTGILCRALRQPALLGYLVAGLIVGPYLPLPVFANPEQARSLADLGVVLVMFVVGLDLRLQRVVSVLPTTGAAALRTGYQVPSGREVLHPGDVIAVAGPPPAIALARSLLQHGPRAPPQEEVS